MNTATAAPCSCMPNMGDVLIWGDPIGVPVSRACPKDGALHAQVIRCRSEVSRGNSSWPTWLAKARRERASTYGRQLIRRLRAGEPPSGGQSVWALTIIRWLEPWRQRQDLKLVLNRRMRTRLSGGVGGGAEQSAPYPDRLVMQGFW